jgi:hypothetical protein
MAIAHRADPRLPGGAAEGAFPRSFLDSLQPLLRKGLKRDGGGFVGACRPRTMISEKLALQLVASGIAILAGDQLLLRETGPVLIPEKQKGPGPAVDWNPGP